MEFKFKVLCGSSEGNIVEKLTTRRLGENDVFIKTTHSGLCGTDEHFLHSDQALGHEGVGVVKHIGSSVTSVKVGDRVGFGFIRRVCGRCDNCISGMFIIPRYPECSLETNSYGTRKAVTIIVEKSEHMANMTSMLDHLATELFGMPMPSIPFRMDTIRLMQHHFYVLVLLSGLA